MSQFVVDLRPPGSHYIFATVRVETAYPDGSTGSGTGFFFQTETAAGQPSHFLITNKHVLDGATSARLRFHYGASNEPWHFTVADHRTVEVDAGPPLWFQHPDPEVDLCALRLSDLQARLPQLKGIFFTAISESEILDVESERRLPSMLTIAMVGYPQGIWDQQNNLPIQRRGTTASHPGVSFDGRREVMIDMACFPGSSGSPVVYHDTQYFASAPRFLGVLYAGPTVTAEGQVLRMKVPTQVRRGVEVQTMMHLGYVIKAEVVRELVNLLGDL